MIGLIGVDIPDVAKIPDGLDCVVLAPLRVISNGCLDHVSSV